MKKNEEIEAKPKKFSIPSFLINKWFLSGIITILTVAILSGLAYYYFFLYPKIKTSSFISAVEENYKTTKSETNRLEEISTNWENTLNGDLDKKNEDLKNIENDFKNLNTKLKELYYDSETKETYKVMQSYSETGEKIAGNLYTIACYFKKVGESVKAFNNLNTNSSNLEELSKLILDFKSISAQALTDIEKIEAPKTLISLDKDYKDLLRQYAKSADDLTVAINEKNTKKIDTVGKDSDAAINAITAQLNEDMKIFKTKNNFTEDLAKINQLRKTTDENIGQLKAKYGI